MDRQFKIRFREQFIKDMEAHKKAGKKFLVKKIETMVDELRKHPITGLGKPEPLKGNRKGQWSRHITKKHRLIYEIKDAVTEVVLVSAFGHYGEK